MKAILLCGIACVLYSFTSVSAQTQFPDSAQAIFNRAMNEINPRYSTWIRTTAVQVNEKKMTETEVKQITTTRWAVLGNISDHDIEALCFLVLMQASKSAQEDLKAIMAKVKAINEQKKKMREALAKMNEKNATISRIQLDSFKLLLIRQPSATTAKSTRAKPVTKAELDNVLDTMKSGLDSLSEQGEEQQLRMQMIMDRMTKADNAASSMLKKFSEVVNSIIANMK
jgi:hypothetical protein